MFLFKPSTRAFTREARKIKGFTLAHWLHGYLYLAFPYAYIGNGVGARRPMRAFRWLERHYRRLFHRPDDGSAGIAFAHAYHGKVVPLETAKKLVQIDQPVSVSYPEQVIPYKTARDLILQGSDPIVLLDCPCRVARKDPCLPLDVCLIVGEPFAGMVIEHHPRRSRRIERAEALDVLEAEERRGHVHHAFFKDAMLGRFYAICNCCSCCCGAMQAQRAGAPMLASSGYLSVRDAELCKNCGACAEVCQFDAIQRVDGRMQVDEALCMGCGVCVSRCEHGALQLVLAPEKGVPMEVVDSI
ncbi:MAG TPA: 4Fe-4S binding protein [Anaerolineaceae bacterium]|nr:4Fe-4S binding protein [Anaerolineaceae bacterium]